MQMSKCSLRYIIYNPNIVPPNLHPSPVHDRGTAFFTLVVQYRLNGCTAMYAKNDMCIDLQYVPIYVGDSGCPFEFGYICVVMFNFSQFQTKQYMVELLLYQPLLNICGTFP